VYPNRCSTFPLIDADGKLVGLITIARLKQLPSQRRRTTLVSELACPLDEVVTCTPSEELIAVVRRMATSADQRALVIDRGKLVGVVSPSDVTRAHEHARLARR